MSTQPTDAEIVAVMREGYNCHYNDEADHIDFARAVLSQWGTPATGGEPVAELVVDRFTTQLKALPAAHDVRPYGTHSLYTSPQPVREPMPRRTLLDMTQCYSDRETFGRAVEAWHGIKGGQT